MNVHDREVAQLDGALAGLEYEDVRLRLAAFPPWTHYAIGGLEYDAGCWIGRALVERTSTGSQQSTTHFVLQLELNGLSTLGPGSLTLLKDNVPGYQPLRNDAPKVG